MQHMTCKVQQKKEFIGTCQLLSLASKATGPLYGNTLERALNFLRNEFCSS